MAPLRRGAAVSNESSSSCSSAKPQSTTVTAARLRASDQTCSSAAGRSSGHRVGPGDAGQHPQLRARQRRDRGQRREVELAVVGQPGGGREAGCLVEQAEHLGDDTAVDVGIDEQRGHSRAGQLGRRGRRRRWCVRALRSAPTPRPAGRCRPRSAASNAVGDVTTAGRRAEGRARARGQRRRVGARIGVLLQRLGDRRRDVGRRCVRRQHVLDARAGAGGLSAASSPGATRPTTATRAAASRDSASRSRRRRSAESSAARAVPAAAAASRSARSTHRRTTVMPVGGARGRRRARPPSSRRSRR